MIMIEAFFNYQVPSLKSCKNQSSITPRYYEGDSVDYFQLFRSIKEDLLGSIHIECVFVVLSNPFQQSRLYATMSPLSSICQR